MCGIVAAAARREVSEILLEGLRRLEYRGYDSAGMALIDAQQHLQTHKRKGKVKELCFLFILLHCAEALRMAEMRNSHNP